MAQAAVVTREGAPVEIRDIELPELSAHDVRVRVAAAGVCHSDLSMVTGTVVASYPLILGHEASGRVVEVGEEVDDLAIGTPVVLNWAPPCRTCWFCLHQEPWLCASLEGVVTRHRGRLLDGTDLHVALGVGAFSEELVLPRAAVVPLPEDTPLELAALLGCAVLTGVGAVRNTAAVRPGQAVLVLGLGGIGLSTVAGAALAGANPIIAVDVVAEKEELARAMGATHFLTGTTQLPREVRRLTGSRGADHAFECVGAGETIRLAWQSLRRGGNCTVVGIGRRDDAVTFNPMELFHFARVLTSSIFGASDPARDVPLMAELVRAGRLDLVPMITHRAPLAGLGEAFDRMRAGHGGRTLLMLAAAPS